MLVAQIEPRTAPERRLQRELTVVAPTPAAERVQSLLLEAKTAALEHLDALQAAIGQTHDLAAAVADGGDAYAVGVQAYARRLTEELFWRGKSLDALLERERASAPAPKRARR
jgi:hypothetical protein